MTIFIDMIISKVNFWFAILLFPYFLLWYIFSIQGLDMKKGKRKYTPNLDVLENISKLYFSLT